MNCWLELFQLCKIMMLNLKREKSGEELKET